MASPSTTQFPGTTPATPDPIARWQALVGAIAAGFAALGGYAHAWPLIGLASAITFAPIAVTAVLDRLPARDEEVAA